MYRLCLVFVFISFQASAIDHRLLSKALKGDSESRYEVAMMFADRKSDFYYPLKAHEMFLSMAREGDVRTFYWLAKSFANPSNPFYAPSRAQFFLSKVDGEFHSQSMLYKVLSGDEPINRLHDLKLASTDPYVGIINILKYYPFYDLTEQQIAEIKHHFSHSSVADFEAYIYPALITPTVGNTALYGVDSLDNNPYFMKTDTIGQYRPLSNSNGVKFVSVGKISQAKTLSLQYEPQEFERLCEYYASFLSFTKIRSGRLFDAPGLTILIKRNFSATQVIFTYDVLNPLFPSLEKRAAS